MSKINPKLNIFSVEKNKSQSIKGSDIKALPKNNYAQNYDNPLNSSNKYLVNFTGLNRNLSKLTYDTADSIKKELSFFPNSKGIVGNFPSDWINKIPKAQRADKIKEVYQDFKAIIKEFVLPSDIVVATEKLNKSLLNAGIINNANQVSLEHIGKGAYGNAYRLKGLSDDNLVLKVFKNNQKFFSACPDAIDIHGKYAEINRAAYWQKYAGKNTQMTRFYFGDTDSGYMVNKYISKETPQAKRYVAPEIYGLRSLDIDDTVSGHNKINGFQFDYGGIYLYDANLNRSKNLQTAFKKFYTSKDKERVKCFKEMAKGADNNMKAPLAPLVDLLPSKDQKKCLDLLKNNKQEPPKGLIKRLKGFLNWN